MMTLICRRLIWINFRLMTCRSLILICPRILILITILLSRSIFRLRRRRKLSVGNCQNTLMANKIRIFNKYHSNTNRNSNTNRWWTISSKSSNNKNKNSHKKYIKSNKMINLWSSGVSRILRHYKRWDGKRSVRRKWKRNKHSKIWLLHKGMRSLKWCISDFKVFFRWFLF